MVNAYFHLKGKYFKVQFFSVNVCEMLKCWSGKVALSFSSSGGNYGAHVFRTKNMW